MINFPAKRKARAGESQGSEKCPYFRSEPVHQFITVNDNRERHHKDSLQKSHRLHIKADHLKNILTAFLKVC